MHIRDVVGATPNTVNTSVVRTRRYLTGREVEKLIEVARKHGRYGPALDAGAQVGHRGRHWEFHLDHIKRAAPQAATLLRADSLGRRKAAMNMRGRSPPGTRPLTTAGFFIALGRPAR